MVIDFITRYSCHTYFHLFQFPDIIDLKMCVLSVMVNDTYFVNYSVLSALFPLKLRILFEKGILGTSVQKDAVPTHGHIELP